MVGWIRFLKFLKLSQKQKHYKMSGLVNKINSAYFEGKNSLNKSKGTIIDIYVENEDDIPFWSKAIAGK